MMSSTSISRSELRVIRAGCRDSHVPGCHDPGCHSVVSQAYATSPLRLLMPRNHGHAAWIYTSSFGGGLVDGDRIEMNVTIADDASAFISTQASTKVYRSPRHGASSELHARLGAGALLVAAPDPVVCFAASRYRQVQRFDLAPGAALIAIDWLSSGRWASGERWAFHEYRAQLSVRVDGRLVVHDALQLSADDGDLSARMGRFEVLAIAVLIAAGDGIGASAGAAERSARLRDATANIVSRINSLPVARRADRLLAATPLEDGCVVRIAGMSVEQVGRTLRDLLAFVPALLGDDPWTRKW